MEWTNKLILEFLKLYEHEPVIWNPKHPKHKNRNEMADAWKRIEASISVECSVQELKKKKDSLMAVFRPLLNKVRASGGTGMGADDAYKPNWFAYRTMARFLQGVYLPRTAVSAEIPDDESAQQGWFKEESLGIDSENGHPLPSESEKNYTEKNCPPPPLSPKKRKIDYTSVDDRLHKAFEILEQAAIEGDECEAFGMFVAKKLKSYTPYTRSTVQHSISNILFRADREYYGQSHSQHHHSDSPIPRSPIHSPDSIPGPSTRLMHSPTPPPI